MKGCDFAKTAVLAETTDKERIRETVLIRGYDRANLDGVQTTTQTTKRKEHTDMKATLRWLVPMAACLVITAAGIYGLRILGGVDPDPTTPGQPTDTISPPTGTADTPTPPVTSPPVTQPPVTSPAALDGISHRRGNSSGNVMNGGYAARDDEWIYYSDVGDNFSVYRMRYDGSEREKLNDDNSHTISVYRDRVYYINLSVDFYGDSGVQMLYSMNIDGSDRRVFIEGYVGQFYIEDDRLYYVNDPVGEAKIYSIYLDGGDKRKLSDDMISQFCVEDGVIYYTSLSDNNNLYSMNTDGGGKTEIIDEYVLRFTVADGTIYYQQGDVFDSKLYSLKIGSKEKTLLMSDMLSQYINVAGDRIYYIHRVTDGGAMPSSNLHSMDLTGGNRIKLSADDHAQSISIVCGRAYYLYFDPSMDAVDNLDARGVTVSVKLDGSDRRVETGTPHTVSPHVNTPAVKAPPTYPLEYYNPILGMFKGGYSMGRPAEEINADRVFVDFGTADAPFVLEFGYLLLGDHDNDRDLYYNGRPYFAHILSINGEPIEPVFVEPVIKGEDPVVYYGSIVVSGGDLDGDGRNDLLLHFPSAVNGDKGGGFFSAFAIRDGGFVRLPVPDYLHSLVQEDLVIEGIGNHNIRITCKDPAFEFEASINSDYAGDIPEDVSANYTMPAYAYSIADGYVELRQYVRLDTWVTELYGYDFGDLVTKLRWDASGKPIVEVRFEAY
jgi:hypothetical protein